MAQTPNCAHIRAKEGKKRKRPASRAQAQGRYKEPSEQKRRSRKRQRSRSRPRTRKRPRSKQRRRERGQSVPPLQVETSTRLESTSTSPRVVQTQGGSLMQGSEKISDSYSLQDLVLETKASTPEPTLDSSSLEYPNVKSIANNSSTPSTTDTGVGRVF